MDLSALTQFFKGKHIFKTHGGSVVGVDIGSSSIKVVELVKDKGRAILKAYGELALGPYSGGVIGEISNLSNDKIAEALRDILRESNIQTKNAGVAIPFRSSLVSLIEMPALPEKKLEEMIPIEARKYIPVPISEVTLDWWIIPKESSYEHVEEAKQKTEKEQNEVLNGIGNGPELPRTKNKTDVLVVSIHNEILSDYNNIVKDNLLDASFFEIEMFSTTRSLVGREEAPILILDLGALGVKYYLIEKGIIRGSHIVNKGSELLTESLSQGLGVEFKEAEKIKRNLATLKDVDKKTVFDIFSLTLDSIWSEGKSFISNYERKYGKHISKCILTGGGVALFGFSEMAEKGLGMKVEMGDPFSKVETPAYLASMLRTTGLEFSVAVGVALRKLEELE